MRIMVGKNAGFCYGVKRAVEGAVQALKQENGKIDCLGELVHNPVVMEELAQQGLEIVDDIRSVTQKAIIRAHGASIDVYDYAKENNITLLDYTCPNVAKIHEIVSKYTQDDFFVFLLGNHQHPETTATKSFCHQQFAVIEKEEEIENAIQKLYQAQKTRLLVVSQTTFSMTLFEAYVEKIKKQLPSSIEVVVHNTICNATQIRQKETEELAKQVDLMVIIGGKNSSNTQKLFAIAREHCQRAICIETAQELENESFENIEKVGIMAGASTSQKSIDEVVRLIERQ